jgi:DNA-binding CsgD family transcriptional regulator
MPSPRTATPRTPRSKQCLDPFGKLSEPPAPTWQAPIVLLTPQQWSDIATQLELTLRQRQILILFFQEQSYGKLAGFMKIAVRTTKAHLAKLRRKLKVRGPAQVILRVWEVHRRLHAKQ